MLGLRCFCHCVRTRCARAAVWTRSSPLLLLPLLLLLWLPLLLSTKPDKSLELADEDEDDVDDDDDEAEDDEEACCSCCSRSWVAIARARFGRRRDSFLKCHAASN